MGRKFLGSAGSVFGVIALSAGACHSGERSVPITTSSSDEAMQVEEVTGFWRVLARTEKGECLMALNRLPVGDAYGVHLETCSILLFKKAAAWRRVDAGFELLDPDQNVIIEFKKAGEDAFAAADDSYRLERAPLA